MNADMDNYFSFNANTEEAKDDQGNTISGGEAQKQGASNGGHPLVPRLNLPRPDPNDQWREMMAQAQSYEVESSSISQSNNQVSSSSG